MFAGTKSQTMKRIMNLSGFLALLGAVVFFSSCSSSTQLSGIQIEKRVHRPGYYISVPRMQEDPIAMVQSEEPASEMPEMDDSKIASEYDMEGLYETPAVVPSDDAMAFGEDDAVAAFVSESFTGGGFQGGSDPVVAMKPKTKVASGQQESVDFRTLRENLAAPGDDEVKPTHWASIIAIVFGALAFIYPPLGVIGVLFGIVAIFSIVIKKRHSGLGLAIAGIASFFLAAILWAILLAELW